MHAAVAAIAQAGVPAADYGHVVMGNVAQTSADAIYLARHVGLRAGLPQDVPALTVNRLCGSGFEAVIQAAMLIQLGEAEVVLAGGTESMSQAPLVLRGTRFGFPFGKPPAMEDMLWSAVTDSYAGMPMALTAEKLAEQHRIGQDEVDEYSVLSQRRWAAAHEAGRFGRSSRPSSSRGRRAPSRSIATSTRARTRPSRASASSRRRSRRTASSTRAPRAAWRTARARWSSRRASTRSDAG